MPAPLSVLLKQSTSAAHEEAESSSFMGDLLEGRLDATALAGLTAQLYAVYGAGWRDLLAEGRIVTVPATKAYATLIREHHSAEFMLANDGLNFYLFPGIGKMKQYKDGYRLRLDALALDTDRTERVLAHAARAFRLNGDIFGDLQSAVGARPQPAA